MAQAVPPIIRRAEARGEQRGEQRGKLKGKRDTLLRLMKLKFGPLNADIRAKIEQISDIDRLDHLNDAVLTASTLSEMPFPED